MYICSTTAAYFFFLGGGGGLGDLQPPWPPCFLRQCQFSESGANDQPLHNSTQGRNCCGFLCIFLSWPSSGCTCSSRQASNLLVNCLYSLPGSLWLASDGCSANHLRPARWVSAPTDAVLRSPSVKHNSIPMSLLGVLCVCGVSCNMALLVVVLYCILLL